MVARGESGRSDSLSFGFEAQSAGTGRGRDAPPDWYDVTWNPTVGCSAVSPGCDHCQALRTISQLARIGGKGGARYAGLTAMRRSRLEWTGEIRQQTDVSTWPLLQRASRRILVASTSDLFHEALAVETLDTLHAVMAIAHWHRFLVLTKRAERMRVYYADPQTPYRIAVAVDDLAATVLPGLGFGGDGAAVRTAAARSVGAGARRLWGAGLARVIRQPGAQSGKSRPAGLHPWPLPNLWTGVSVEGQGWIDRIGHLLQTPAALRWACFEPLLGPVGPDAVPVGEGYVDALIGDRYLLDGRGRMVPVAGPGWRPLDWVVAGGETGAGARPTDPDWVRVLRDRCVAAGVPFLFKQWGEWAPVPDPRFGQRMARIGRRNAGRLIDGRCWNEMPAAMLKSGGRRR